MNLKTLDKKDAVHVLNMMSMIMAWGVTGYFFEAVITTHSVELLSDFLMSPIYFVDSMLFSFTGFTVSGNFNLMFILLWISYALPVTALYPFLMIRHHDEKDLKTWYLSRSATQAS
ncbi:MAG: hypothetical protein M3Q95_02125 [Bacteroidota bacterium]|nr:hypothetical protein [Bacteroidota bacterium]